MFWTNFRESIEWAFGVRKPYALEDVFTSGTPADVNYVRRLSLEGILKQNIKVKGNQLIVFGHSGSGKTTIIQKVLKDINQNFIYTLSLIHI